MRTYILLFLSILVGLLAFVIANRALKSQFRKLNLQAKRIRVVAPKQDMVKGDVIQSTAELGVRTIYAADASGDELQVANKDYEAIIGQKLAANVKRGVPLRWQDFEAPDRFRTGSLLARTIPRGNRALAIAVDNVSSVAGMIRPNDRVDLIGTFRFPNTAGSRLDTVTLTMLENVTVLAVGQHLAANSRPDARQQSYSTITVSVSPAEVEMLVFAQQKGKLTFTLRNPTDFSYQKNLESVNFDLLQKNLKTYQKQRLDRVLPNR